jgi:DNA-binding MarR family transcriptional regulator
MGMTIVHDMNKKNRICRAHVSDSQVEKFQELIAGLYSCCIERMQFQSEKLCLPNAQMRCLLLFADAHYLTPKVISREMSVAKSRVTTIINSLMQKGLIRQFKDPNDSRIHLLSLTAEGRQKVTEIRSFRGGVYRQVLSLLEPEQRQVMLAHLELLKSSMEAVRESPA